MATTNGEFFLTMLAQQGKGYFNLEGTKVAFDGPEGQRALQLIVDMINRDRIDAYDRPNPPNNVPAIASPVVASQWVNSSAVSGAQRAGLDPAQHLVAFPTPDFTTTRKVAADMGGTWQMITKQTRDVDAAVELTPEGLMPARTRPTILRLLDQMR